MADGTLENAYRAFVKGRWSVADKQLRSYLDSAPESEEREAARYLLSLVLQKRARRAKRAADREALRHERAEILTELQDYEALAGPIRRALGDYHAKSDPDAALQHYLEVPKGGVHYLRARTAAAHLAMAAGDPKRALALVEEALEAGPSRRERGKLLILEARALAETGKKETSVALLRRLWVDHYGKSLGRQAEKELRRLKRSVGADEKVVLEASRITGGQRNKLLKRRKRLLREYRSASKAARAYSKGVINMVTRKTWRGALRDFERASAARKSFVRGFAMFGLGRAQERLEKPEAAIATWTALQAKWPGHPMAAEALVRASRRARKLGRHEQAMTLLETLVKEYPTHPERVEYWWDLAWTAWKAQEWETAAERFDQIAREEGQRKHWGQATWGERAIYWRGRCELKLGKKTEALSSWAYLVGRFPLTYYSHLSFNRLAALEPARARRLRPNRPIEPWDQEALTVLSALRINQSPALDTAVELTRMGLYSEAREDLKVRARRGALDSDGMTLLLSLGLRDNRYRESASVIRWRGTLPRYPDEGGERLWKLAYPLPFWDTVKRFADKFGVNRYLVMALIRHESAYNPNAVSKARAMGLMQLLPATAKSVAKKLLNTRGPNNRQLKRPVTNVRLGTRLLRELMDHFGDNEALALAAYNAGAGRARGWYRERRRTDRMDTDAYVEEIPYRQTHSYVKSILATYGAYRYLYGSREEGGNRTVPLEPELPRTLGPYFGKRFRVE